MSVAELGIEQVGSRCYVTGDSFKIKDKLKSVGCHFDPQRKQWWIGTAKRDVLESVVSNPESVPEKSETEKQEELSRRPCTAKAEYKGRTYFVIGSSQRTGKFHLTVMDCSINFWAPMSEVTIVKRYEPRRVRGQEIPQTIAGIRRFIAQQQNPNTRRVQCVECDAWHNADEQCRECGGC